MALKAKGIFEEIKKIVASKESKNSGAFSDPRISRISEMLDSAEKMRKNRNAAQMPEAAEDLGERISKLESVLDSVKNDVSGKENCSESKKAFEEFERKLDELSIASKKRPNNSPDTEAVESRVQARIDSIVESMKQTTETMELLSSKINGLDEKTRKLVPAKKESENSDGELAKRCGLLEDAVCDIEKKMEALESRETEGNDGPNEKYDDLYEEISCLKKKMAVLEKDAESNTLKIKQAESMAAAINAEKRMIEPKMRATDQTDPYASEMRKHIGDLKKMLEN